MLVVPVFALSFQTTLHHFLVFAFIAAFSCNFIIYGIEMTRDNIDEIVLVGGTTRIPKVKQQLRYTFLCVLSLYSVLCTVVFMRFVGRTVGESSLFLAQFRCTFS